MYAKVANEFSVKESTVHCRILSVGLSLSEFNALKQKLTPVEEDTLVISILEASQHGFPPTHHQIAMKADWIQSSCSDKSYQLVGKQWVNEFLWHHDKLVKSYWSAPLSTLCAQSANLQTIHSFLMGLVKSEVVDKHVPPELLYQIDETLTPQQLRIKLQVVWPQESRLSIYRRVGQRGTSLF